MKQRLIFLAVAAGLIGLLVAMLAFTPRCTADSSPAYRFANAIKFGGC